MRSDQRYKLHPVVHQCYLSKSVERQALVTQTAAWEAGSGSYLTKQPPDAWSSWKTHGAGRHADSRDPCSCCAGCDVVLEGSRGENVFLSTWDIPVFEKQPRVVWKRRRAM